MFKWRYTRPYKGMLRRSIRYVAHKAMNDPCNSIISFMRAEEGQKNSRGKLKDSTFVVKDNIATTRVSTTCGSKMLEKYISPFDATVVELLEHEGSLLIGKANMDEFGMGSSGTNSAYGATLNYSHDEKARIAGGSSGGSAVAVATGLASFSLGTDTGGSVRLPADYNGIIGFKPSYGRISRWGVVPYAQSLDTVGILARDVSTVGTVFSVLDRFDAKDPTSLSQKEREHVEPAQKETYTIGVPKEFMIGELSSRTRENWISLLLRLQEKGHVVKEISIPSIKASVPAYYTLTTAEAASNLSRYDGVRYGYNSGSSKSPIELISRNRSHALGPEVKRRIILGNYTLSSNSADHYIQATKVRKVLVNEFNDVFNCSNALFESDFRRTNNKVDFIVAPTSMGIAPTVEEYEKKNEANFLNSYLNDVFTIPSSLTGLPTITIPINNQGFQIIGQFCDDMSVLNMAKLMSDKST